MVQASPSRGKERAQVVVTEEKPTIGGNRPNLQAKKAVFGKGKSKSGKGPIQKGKSTVMVVGDCPEEMEVDIPEENAVGSAVAEEMVDVPEEEVWEEMEESPSYDPWVETYVVWGSVSRLHHHAWNGGNLCSCQTEMAALVGCGASGNGVRNGMVKNLDEKRCDAIPE